MAMAPPDVVFNDTTTDSEVDPTQFQVGLRPLTPGFMVLSTIMSLLMQLGCVHGGRRGGV